MDNWQLYAAAFCAGIWLLAGSRKRHKKRRSNGKGIVLMAAAGGVLAVAGGGGGAVSAMGSAPHPHVASASLESFRACVIHRESGGNPQIWNHQGYPYWGLYQFGKPLWTAYGGSASSWGNAGANTQTQVFYNVMAHQGGCQNWYPSDGCTYPANGCG